MSGSKVNIKTAMERFWITREIGKFWVIHSLTWIIKAALSKIKHTLMKNLRMMNYQIRGDLHNKLKRKNNKDHFSKHKTN
jgi:hypothetical protein